MVYTVLVDRGLPILAILLLLLGTQFLHEQVADNHEVFLPTQIAEDPSASLDVDAVAAGALSFRPMRGKRENLGATDSAFWLRFEITHDAPVPEKRWLTVGGARLHHISLYERNAGRWRLRDESGGAQPFSDRKVATIMPAFALDLPAHSSQELLVRVSSQTLVFIQPALWEPVDLVVTEERKSRDEYIGAGATLLVLVICLLLAIILGETGFLVFGLAVLSFQLFRWSASGLAFRELWPASPHWAVSSIGVFMALTGLLTVLLHRQLLETARYFPRLDLALRVLLAGFALLCLAVPFAPDRHMIMAIMLWGLALSVISPVLGFMALRRGAPMLGYCLAGYALPWHLIEIQYFVGIGWFPHLPRPIVDYNRAWASMFSAAIVLTALGERIHRMRHERERMKREHIEELEARVMQRTVELHRAKDVAEGALTDQRRLLNLVSHELRTPLANIGAATQLLELGCRESGDQAVLGRIRRATERVAQFLENCLTGERLASSGWMLHEARIDIARLAQETLENIEHAAPGHYFRLTLPPGLPDLRGDPQLLRALLHNLLENAVKYSPAGSVVELAAARPLDRRLTLAVTDNGNGIAAENLDRLFDKFYRCDESGDSNVPGVGLGLYLVKQIAELHGAGIAVQSRLGDGTRIEITFPEERLYP